MLTRSRIVAWLRVVMPLAALALLSVLFLLGRKPAPGGIPYANVDPQELAQNAAMTAPNYAGVTPDGSEVTLTATHARPDAAGGLDSIDAVQMTLTSPEGRKTNLQAGQALMQGDDDVRLTGGVRLTTEDGWIVTAPEFLAGIRDGSLSADEQVNVTAPFGELTAGRMDLRPINGGNHVLDLKGGVRLIYRP